MSIDPKLLDLLVCPVDGSRLRYDSETSELVSDSSGFAYPVRDGIPIMLIDEARKIDRDSAGINNSDCGSV